MLFRDNFGNLIQINNKDYNTDKDYYTDLMRLKNIKIIDKPKNVKNRIINLINDKSDK